jgi:hypothetical protein
VITGGARGRGRGPLDHRAAQRLAGHAAVDVIARRRRIANASSTGRAATSSSGEGTMNSTSFALFVLFAINLMNFFDRQIIGGVGEGIRREWGLSDTALGLLGTVFTLLYALVGLPLGRLSDRKQRRLILAGACSCGACSPRCQVRRGVSRS